MSFFTTGMSKKIYYVANMRLPTEKAHGVQIMKMCEAFARQGAIVELVVPNRRTHITGDPFVYYGVEENFSITRLSVIDSVSFGRLGFLLETLSFAVSAFFHIRGTYADAIFGRDETILFPLSFLSVRKIIWETHTGAWNYVARKMSKRASAIITISQGLKDFYLKHGVAKEKLFVAHDGVDLADYEISLSQKEARAHLGLPDEKRIALYVGRLDGWKGVDTLYASAHFLPEDIMHVVIGGDDKDLGMLREMHPKVRFLGYRPYTELARNLRAADVLVLPNNGKNEISVSFTSPLKLFAYMASGLPIVASDLPSLREILDEETATLVEADSPLALAEGIQRVFSVPQRAEIHGKNAKQKVQAYSWEKRAQAILVQAFPEELDV